MPWCPYPNADGPGVLLSPHEESMIKESQREP